MILTRLLEHDLHRAKAGVEAVPLILETPAKSNFVPALVSTIDSGRFLVTRRLTKDGKLRSAVFKHDPDKIDDILRPLIDAAYSMSEEEKFPNRFSKPAAAFNYVFETSGTGAHPHILLIPETEGTVLEKWLGKEYDGRTYKKICRVVSADVTVPVFFSRPDFVGLYTQFLGGRSSIALHNVGRGLAFVSRKAWGSLTGS